MKVSVVMSNYNGALYLDEAIASVLRQTHSDLELLIGDDASTDELVMIIQRWQKKDPRVSLIAAKQNGGASAARNRCLETASGNWIAIVDSDDVLHPERFARLLSVAESKSAAFVADDMLFFSKEPRAAGRTLLQDLNLTQPWSFTAGDFIRSDIPGSTAPPLGYLKPILSASVLKDQRYDESLQISEDFDFYLRFLMKGGPAVVLPEPMYGYRRHAASLSHRLSVAAVSKMIAAQDKLEGELPDDLQDSMQARRRGLGKKLTYEHLVNDIKQRSAASALRRILIRPVLVANLIRSIWERSRKARHTHRDKSPLRLSLGQKDAKSGQAIQFPAIPPAGGAWDIPVAPIAAQLSALASVHELEIQAHDEVGEWARWLVPFQCN